MANETKAPRFVILSVLLHAAGLFALLFVSATQFETPKFDTITIDLADHVGTEPLPDGEVTPAAEGAGNLMTPIQPAVVAEPVMSTPMAATEPVATAPVAVEKAAAPVVAAVPAPAKVVEAKPVAKTVAPKISPPAPKEAPVVKSSPLTIDETPVKVAQIAPAPTPAPEVPASLDDIETPDLPEPIAKVVPFKETMNTGELDSDLEKVDASSKAAVAAVESELGQDSEKLAAGSDQAVGEIENENAQHAAAIGARLDGVREKNAKALAEAREKAAAGNQGSGGNATGAAATGTAGVAGGVRKLEQLRQMPGNPKPKYSEAERLERKQGEVVYVAYVNKEGQMERIKQTLSTGHKSLDQKTLAALKDWKFFPGQEGWVEIPIKWDLKGGPQEMSALSRRKVSLKTAE